MSLRRHSARLVAISLLLAVPAIGAMAAEGPPTTISTVAGNGQRAFGGDGGPATAAALASPRGVAPLPGGGFLVADTANDRVRRVDGQGRIATVAGNGSDGFSGDGGPATAAQLSSPTDVAALPGGGFLIADAGNGRIRRVAADGSISTVAGNGLAVDGPLGGDGGRARATHLDHPRGVAAASGREFLIADTGHNRVRSVSDGTISTVAGTEDSSAPADVAAANGGDILVADTGNGRVRRVGRNGSARTVVGGLNGPEGVAQAPGNSVLIADTGNNRVLRVQADGDARVVAGTGVAGYNGDGRAPRLARLNSPMDVAVQSGAHLLIADTRNQRIRLLAPPSAGPSGPNGGKKGPALGPPAKPQLRKRFNARPKRGKVRVRLPGTRAAVDLDKAASVPVGSLIDASQGTVALTVARNSRGTTQSGNFKGGAFVVIQTRSRRPVTELRLRGGDFKGCGAARAVAAARKGRRARKLWAHVKGRFRTRGRHAAATVRGTMWLTKDTCAGTLTFVRRGLVAVRDFTLRKTFMVSRGHSHFAPAHRRKR